MLNNSVTLRLSCAFPASSADASPSPRVVEGAAMFGLGADQSRTVAVLPPTDLTLRPGQIVFVTGASGSGKSTLLRLIREQLAETPGVALIDFAAFSEPRDAAVVDAVDAGLGDEAMPLGRVLRVLSLSGLNDAFVMLRRPSELSDGQRYRFGLARAMARVESLPSGSFAVVLADEFGATLDRITAAALSRNLRRWVDQSRRVCVVAATTHDDLLEPLAPDVLVEKHPGEGIDVLEAKR